MKVAKMIIYPFGASTLLLVGCAIPKGTVSHPDIKPPSFKSHITVHQCVEPSPLVSKDSWTAFNLNRVWSSDLAKGWEQFQKDNPGFKVDDSDPDYKFDICFLGTAYARLHHSLFSKHGMNRMHAASAFRLVVMDRESKLVHTRIFKYYRFIRAGDFEGPIRTYPITMKKGLSEVLAYISRGDFKAQPSDPVHRIVATDGVPFKELFTSEDIVFTKPSDGNKAYYNELGASFAYFLFMMHEDQMSPAYLQALDWPNQALEIVAALAKKEHWPYYPKDFQPTDKYTFEKTGE